MYNKIKLYPEIKAEMEKVIEAEENAKAWRQEAATRMRPVNLLIRTAQQLSGSPIDKKALLDAIRAELSPETPAPDAQDVENATEIPDTTEPDA